MAKVVHRDRPHIVLYEGDDPEAFVAANEPRPHVQDGQVMPQLQVLDEKESGKDEEE